jgi:cytochrome c oxidase cbb3-type subunit 2
MNRAVVLYIAIFVTVLFSFAGLVAIPDLQMREIGPVTDDSGQQHPVPWEGIPAEGRQVYIELGCIYCHSQQVRPEGFGADIDRGWGMRRSVARDYIYDTPHLLSTMRTGPDLANIGVRQPSDSWHYQHLYDPYITSPGSNMPKFPFLFERRQIVAETPSDAVSMPEGRVDEGWVLVPTDEGKALVAYLKHLNQSYDVPEVP